MCGNGILSTKQSFDTFGDSHWCVLLLLLWYSFSNFNVNIECPNLSILTVQFHLLSLCPYFLQNSGKSTQNITIINFYLRLTAFISLPGFLQARLDIVRLIRGSSCTIQGKDSNTLLHIPDGVYAAVLGNIHTNPSKFQHHIPRNDCLVGPICEYHLEPFIGKILPTDAKYKIYVPHTVRNVHQTQKYIRVRCGDIHNGILLPVHKLEKDRYEIDEKYVTIHAKHFSGYIGYQLLQ